MKNDNQKVQTFGNFLCFQGVIMLILATDMARHNEILEAFKAKVAKGFDFNSDEAVNAVIYAMKIYMFYNPIRFCFSIYYVCK